MVSIAKAFVPVFASTVFALANVNAETPRYSFQIVARTGASIAGSTITDLSGPPLLNNNGEIVFPVRLTGGQAIVTPDNIIVKQGDTVDGEILTSVDSPALNASGTVAFVGGFATGSGIFSQSKLLVKTGDTVDGQSIFNFYSGIGLNKNGDVAFEAATGTFAPTSAAVFVLSQTAPATLVSSTGQNLNGKTLNGLGSPVLSDSGEIAFRGDFLNSANPNDTGVIAANVTTGAPAAVLIETGDTVSNETLNVFGYPSALENSKFAVVPASFAGGTGIFKIDLSSAGGQGEDSRLLVKTGDTIGGKTLTSLGLATANSAGDIAFYGSFEGGQGIFTRSNLLIKTGDAIGLDTVDAMLSNSVAYNAHGTIVFAVQLSDGTKAIVMGRNLGAL